MFLMPQLLPGLHGGLGYGEDEIRYVNVCGDNLKVKVECDSGECTNTAAFRAHCGTKPYQW